MKIEIEACFRAFLPEAVARFGYLYPDVEVEVAGDHVLLRTELAGAASEFKFALYRQKIFSETLDLRRALISGIVG